MMARKVSVLVKPVGKTPSNMLVNESVSLSDLSARD